MITAKGGRENNAESTKSATCLQINPHTPTTRLFNPRVVLILESSALCKKKNPCIVFFSILLPPHNNHSISFHETRGNKKKSK